MPCLDLSRRLHRRDSERRTHDYRREHVDDGVRRPRAQGPVNDPVIISSFADFQRQFGGCGSTAR